LEIKYLKITNVVAPPPAQAKVDNVALAMKYSLSVALTLKRLDTPDLEHR